MSWNALTTTLAFTGFIAVFGSAAYVMQPEEPELRAKRLCEPVRDVRDSMLSFFGVADIDRVGEHKLYLELNDYIHTDICTEYGIRWFWGAEIAQLHKDQDKFRESLYTVGLTPDEIDSVIDKGYEIGIDWSDEAQTQALLNDYLEYKQYLAFEKQQTLKEY